MKTEKALYIELSQEIGQFLHGPKSGQSIEELARYHRETYLGARAKHQEYRIAVCDRPVYEKTGLKAFDKEHAKIGFLTGNVSSNIQFSRFVRSELQTACNGYQFPIGHLRNLDLTRIKEISRSNPDSGAEVVLKWYQSQKLSFQHMDTIFYMVFHPGSKKGHKIVHGWIQTDTRGNLLNELVNAGFTGSKSFEVMSGAKEAFTLKRFNEKDVFVVKGGVIELDLIDQDEQQPTPRSQP